MMLAGFITLSNTSKDQNIRIRSAESADFGLVEMHTTIEVDGVARMQELKNVVIEAGRSREFKPGHEHFMLMRPKRALVVGDVVKIRLRLCKKHHQVIEFKVMEQGERQALDVDDR